MHFLDLPVLARQPPFSALDTALQGLEPQQIKDFEAREPLDRGVRQWLARLSVSELDQLGEDEGEDLRTRAAQRLALECGVTAGSSNTRLVELPLPDACSLRASTREHAIVVHESARSPSSMDTNELTLDNKTVNGSTSMESSVKIPESRALVVRLSEPGLVEDHLGRLTWGSSLVLAKRIVRDPGLVSNRKILELGAGTGLCGIASAFAGASSVDVTDLPDIVPNLEKNVQQNLGNSAEYRAYVLDWANPPSVLPAVDVCIVSDPVYSREHPALLLNAVSKVNAREVLLQLPLRPTFEAERDHIFEGLVALGYECTVSEIESGRDLFGEQKFLYRHYDKRS